MYLFYSFLFYLALPFVTLRLLWKSRLIPAYRQRMLERFAYRLPRTSQRPLLIHAVSVGEFLAVKPLINQLLKENASLQIWITTMTPTGSEQVKQFQQTYPNRIIHSYLPYDTPIFMRRFLNHIQPRAVILIETEIWPSLILEAAKICPVLLINARLSAKSLRRYWHYARCLLYKPLKYLQVNAQSRNDARRLRYLGVPTTQITIIPNLKYQPSITQLSTNISITQQHHIWLAASTHEPEEHYVLMAHNEIRKQYPDAQLIIAPRHPERRKQIIQAILDAGYTPRLRSQNEWLQTSTDVLLLDTLGELNQFYNLAKVAFIGGSLVQHGGHNPLEAIHNGCSVCFGQSMYNFHGIVADLLKTPFVRQINEPNHLGTTILALLIQHSSQQDALRQFKQQHQNILSQHLSFIYNYI